MKTKQANYEAWSVAESDFPSNVNIAEKIKFLMGYGVLAPSTHNTQPWEFHVNYNELTITSNPRVSLDQADPAGRNLQISLGCCVTNILIAASYFGLSTQCRWAKSKIVIKFEIAKPDKSLASLFRAIPKRYSDKLPYKNMVLKENHKDNFLSSPQIDGCRVTLITDNVQKEKTAEMHAQATVSYKNNRAFFEELSQWLRPSKTQAEDGMPGFVVGLSNGQSKIFKALIRKFKPTIKLLAKKDCQAIISSSSVGFITTQTDDPQSWFKAGRYYELLALQATTQGLAITPLAAMIENKTQRSAINKELNIAGSPQIFFRLGYSTHAPYHTPRRKTPGVPIKTQQRLANNLGVTYENKQIKVGKYNINYIVAGEGKPILMLHGANIGWAQWYQNIADFAKYFTVYAIDMPGAGSSTTVNFHKIDFVKDYLKIVEQFIQKMEFDKIDIVGSSFGGWIALKLAIENKPYLHKVVLTNPLGFTTHMPIQFRPVSLQPLALFLSKTALRPVRSNKNLEKFMRDVFYDKKLHLSKRFVDYFYELSQTSHNILFISRLAHITGMRKELFLAGDLPNIKVPIFVIWGKKDPLMPFKTVEKNIHLIPNVKLETLEQVGHMPPVEVPKKFDKLAIGFLVGKNSEF